MYYLTIEKPKGYEEKMFDTFKQLNYFLSNHWVKENNYLVSINNQAPISARLIWGK